MKTEEGGITELTDTGHFLEPEDLVQIALSSFPHIWPQSSLSVPPPRLLWLACLCFKLPLSPIEIPAAPRSTLSAHVIPVREIQPSRTLAETEETLSLQEAATHVHTLKRSCNFCRSGKRDGMSPVSTERNFHQARLQEKTFLYRDVLQAAIRESKYLLELDLQCGQMGEKDKGNGSLHLPSVATLNKTPFSDFHF